MAINETPCFRGPETHNRLLTLSTTTSTDSSPPKVNTDSISKIFSMEDKTPVNRRDIQPVKGFRRVEEVLHHHGVL